MKDDDDDIQDYVSSSRRKKEMDELGQEFDKAYAEYNTFKQTRNNTLEEVAKEIEKLPFGDTASSFAIFVRNMKR